MLLVNKKKTLVIFIGSRKNACSDDQTCSHIIISENQLKDIEILKIVLHLKIYIFHKISKGAKIRNRYNQVPHLKKGIFVPDRTSNINLKICENEIYGSFLTIQHLAKCNKASKGAKIRNRYNQVPHLTQDTNGKVTNSQLATTNENQKVNLFPAGDHKAHMNRRAQRHSKQKTEKKHTHKISTKEVQPWNGQ